MKFIKTDLEGLTVIEPDKFLDDRGYFLKSFERKIFEENGISMEINQINHSFNLHKGTLRGMHMQKAPFEEAKLVQCIKGSVYDVAIDMREGSKTYGKWHGEELSEENKIVFFIPEGFAHGFITLLENTEVLYFMSGEYSKPHEIGYRWNDPYFKITWPLEPTVIAEKDKDWPLALKKYD